jgi:hypothetical protein
LPDVVPYALCRAPLPNEGISSTDTSETLVRPGQVLTHAYALPARALCWHLITVYVFCPSIALPCTIPPVSYVPCTIFVSQPPRRVQKAPAIVHGGASQGRKPYTARGARTKSSVLGRRTGKRLSPYVTGGSVLPPAPGGASYGGLMVPAVVRRASGGAIPGLRRQNGAVPAEAARLNDMRPSYAAPRVT